MKPALPIRRDGEWHAPRRRGYLLQCCNCGLVHRMEFRLRLGQLQMRGFRLTRAEARQAIAKVGG